MRIIFAARLSGVIFLISTLFTLILTRTGFRMMGVALPRQVWLTENSALWAAGWWLWLLAIFSWMLLLITLMWSYLPSHRLNSMVQSGLILIGAILSMAGVVIWMNVLPATARLNPDPALISLVDGLALSLLGAGLSMAGVATVWLLVDLGRLKILNRSLLIPGILSGCFLLPTPWLLPRVENLAISLLLWLFWCGWLATQSSFPKAFSEWK